MQEPIWVRITNKIFNGFIIAVLLMLLVFGYFSFGDVYAQYQQIDEERTVEFIRLDASNYGFDCLQEMIQNKKDA